jgi:acyl-CoA synthetase (AMP-forming)/AMP-acid ligase II
MVQAPETATEPTLPAVLHRAAETFGSAPLLVTATERLTFVDAERRSRLLARRLVGSGVGKGTRVGIHAGYGADVVVAFLAAGRIGALVAPLSSAYVAAELGSAIRRADVDTLLVPPTILGRDEHAMLEDALPSLAAGLRCEEAPFLRQVVVLGEATRPWATALDALTPVGDDVLDAIECEVMPADLLTVIQTSGSTAEPKGVLHTHGGAMRKTAGPVPGPLFLAMPFFWVGGLAVLCAALHNGITLVCQERFDPAEALDLIEEHGVVLVGAWPTVFDALRAEAAAQGRPLTCVPPPTTDGSVPPYALPLGMTETFGPHMTFPHPELGMDPPAELRGSLGVTAPFFEHRLVDVETHVVVEGEGTGELWVRGYALAAGLYKREREEFVDADGWYHTGDLVARRGGLWWFVGRCTEMIKVRGANVAPPEVEAALEFVEGVKHAFVLGAPHPQFEQQVVAVVVPEAGVELDPAELRRQVSERLSSFKVPSVVITLADEEVPWLGTGKPDKRALLAHFP